MWQYTNEIINYLRDKRKKSKLLIKYADLTHEVVEPVIHPRQHIDRFLHVLELQAHAGMLLVPEDGHVGPNQHPDILKSPDEVPGKSLFFRLAEVRDTLLYLGVGERGDVFQNR